MDRQSCSLADVVWMPMRYIDGGRALVHTAKSPTARFALASCSISARAFVRLCVDVSRMRERERGRFTDSLVEEVYSAVKFHGIEK